MFRRTLGYVSALIVLVLAGCQDSGPFGLDRNFEKGPEFELFDGGWASLHVGFPNLLTNGGFEDGLLTGWTALPPSPLNWEVTSEAANSGSFGLSGRGEFLLLRQPVNLPDATIKLSWFHRYENTSAAPIWSSTLYKVQVVGGDLGAVTVWDAADLGAPPVSGGGAVAAYEQIEVDISFMKNTSNVGLVFVAEAPDEFFLDLDDIEIYVVPDGGGAVDVPFLEFGVTDAKVKLKKKSDKDEFEIKKGEFTLGDASDGFDLDTEDITITFGELEFTIEAGSFVRNDDDDDDDDGKWKFRGKKPGITHVDIRDDGRFKIKAKDLDLSEFDLDEPVTFTLTIGDDTGTFDIEFDGKGRFKVKKDDGDD